MKVSAKNAPFSLWGGCSYCNQQDKNDPGMRVSEAVTRDASQVSKLGDIRGADEKFSRLLFGEHTFFFDGSGLNVLEPTEMPEKEIQAGEIVSLASWSDATLTESEAARTRTDWRRCRP